MKTSQTDPFNFGTFALNVISSLPLRRKTRATYLSMLNRHILPYLRNTPLDQVLREQIQEIICKLSPQTAAMTLAVLKCVFREAKNRQLITSSPAHGISGPQIMVAPRKFMTWEEIKEHDFGKYKTQIHFLALHGLRWSEALALSTDDIRDGRIHVNKSVHGPTKSRAGIRTIPLISEFKEFPRSPKTLNRVLKPYSVSVHSLRHSYAYLLKQQGVHVTTAQRLLGHSDPRVTMNIYTRVLDSEIDDAGLVLRNAIAR
jgi:integrase